MPNLKPHLKLYNTLTDKKDTFKPLKGKTVHLFVCGLTVYDYAHLGNARTYVIFDAFAKYLKYIGYKVQYLQNITDVDDKIIVRAREKGVDPKDLALAFEKEYIKDMKSLGITSVTKYARATAHIKEIISQIKRLQDKGFAYQIPDDGVYYDITKFKRYGKLSGRTALQAEDAMSRIDYSRYKRNRGDFCLWKFRQDDSEPSWPSPFGQGRPGWHIEDTAITEKFFGPQYDIHGGARDLIFPHHEAEIAQMEAISGKTPLVRYWMHVGFLTVDGQKMSKSIGNFITLDDFLKRYSSQLLRYLIVKHLWRSPLDFSETAMIEVKSSLEKITEFLRKLKSVKATISPVFQLEFKKAQEGFWQALADDFNTPMAFAALFELMRKINPALDQDQLDKKTATKILKFFKEVDQIFSILDFKNIGELPLPTQVKQLLAQRQEARQAADWQKSDQLRQEITKYGYMVQDTKDGQVIKKL